MPQAERREKRRQREINAAAEQRRAYAGMQPTRVAREIWSLFGHEYWGPVHASWVYQQPKEATSESV